MNTEIIDKLIIEYTNLLLDFIQNKNESILVKLKEIEQQTGLNRDEMIDISCKRVSNYYNSKANTNNHNSPR